MQTAEPARIVLPRRKRAVNALAMPLLLLAIVLGFYWKLSFTDEYDWAWSPDLAQQVVPWFDEEARQLQHSQLPLWDSHTWAGQPLLAQAQPGAAYPLNWILFALPRQGGHIAHWALNAYYLAIHFMAALFAYLLCRDLGRSRAASVIAGMLFSFAAFVGNTDWPQMMNGAVWAPLVLMYLLRAARGRNPVGSAALSGMCLGFSWLSGHHQIPLYLTLTAVALWAYFTFEQRPPRWNLVACAGLALAIMLLTGALQILPSAEYGHLALRWAGTPDPLGWSDKVPYYIHGQYSMPIVGLLAIVYPTNPIYDPFVGVVAFTLALIAVALCWRYSMVKLFAALAVASLVFALGTHSVLSGMLTAIVPMLEKARAPSRALVIFSVAVPVLAAYGIDQFPIAVASKWPKRIVLALVVFGLVTIAVSAAILFSKNGEIDERRLLTAFIALLLAALLSAWHMQHVSGTAALVLLGTLLVFELGQVTSTSFADRKQKPEPAFIATIQSNGDIANFLEARMKEAPFRIETATDRLVPNWGDYHGLDVVMAMLASVTANIYSLEWHTWNGRMLLGVRYTLADKPTNAHQNEVFAAASGIKVFENPGAFPRSWTVHKISGGKSVGDLNIAAQQRLGDLRKEAFMHDKPPAINVCDSALDRVSYERYQAERYSLHIDMACDGLLVTTDTYYPGWVAKVDGKNTPIYEVNAAMRGIVIPRGSHEVTFHYRPPSILAGALLTLLGIAGTIFMSNFWPKHRQTIDSRAT